MKLPSRRPERWIAIVLIGTVVLGALFYSPWVAIAALIGFVITRFIPGHHTIALVALAIVFILIVRGHAMGITYLVPAGLVIGALIGTRL